MKFLYQISTKEQAEGQNVKFAQVYMYTGQNSHQQLVDDGREDIFAHMDDGCDPRGDDTLDKSTV